MRDAYRAALRGHRQAGSAAPPDPYATGGLAALVDFFNSSETPAMPFSRYVHSLLKTWPRLTSVFPDVAGRDRRHFVWWLNRYARVEGPIASVIELPSLLPTPASAPAAHGVNVAGYLNAESGLAVSARRIIAALTAVQVPVSEVAYRRTMSRQEVSPKGATDAPFDVNVVCITAEQFPLFHADMGQEFFAGRYTIGYWFWELETFPADQLGALDLVDEVWVATTHIRDAVAPLTTRPVLHMPIPLPEPRPSARDRTSFGLSDDYLFLFAFDFHSVMERKHPLAAASAFRAAFPEPGGARLVLKSINGDRWPEQAELVRCAVADRPDITLMEEYLSEADQAALMASADCYVSLHRAEGLGLGIADAMALGKPVIATRYSGNLDFMDDDNSFLVPFTYTTVPPGTPAYPTGARWADPDLAEAARLMRTLVEDPERGRTVGARARLTVLGRWSTEEMGARMRDRLQEVWTRRAKHRA
jgi:glycosyltransferase involved in cell wall biosynthesis